VTCAQCREREAIVFIRRQNGSGEASDVFLCEPCARARGIVAGKGRLELSFEELIAAGLDRPSVRAATSRCPACGSELSAIVKGGRLGCPACLEAFYPELKRGLSSAPGIEGEEIAFLASPAERMASSGGTARGGGAPSSPAASQENFQPKLLGGLALSGGPEDDVVLGTSARVFRDLEGLPFPGVEGGTPEPSRGLLLEKAFSIPPWAFRTMAELGPVLRRSLAERGVASRSYASDDSALLAYDASCGMLATIDDVDHLRLRSMRGGFDPRGALGTAVEASRRIGGNLRFARNPDVGWVCARLADCGVGAALSASVHLPAIAMTGMGDRLFKALMSEGVAVGGFYGSEDGSSGSLYELSAEGTVHPSLESMVRALSRAVAKAVQAERRAREEVSEKETRGMADVEGRAFGVARYCSLLGADEAAGVVSSLRLAALRGTLRGAAPRRLGELLVSLGSATVCLGLGLSSIPDEREVEALRAGAVKAAIEGADYSGMEEGASRCSRA